MKTLSIIALATTLLAPVAAFADSTPAANSPSAPAAQNASTGKAANVAMTKRDAASVSGYGIQASDDRQGLSRVQQQARQLGAAN